MNEITTSIEDQNLPTFTEKQVELLKNTYCKGATDEEFSLFCYVAEKTGLNPFLRQIHPVFRKQKQSDGTYKQTMTIQTGIDGLRVIADRTGRYCAGREPSHTFDKNGVLVSSTAYVKKQTKDGTWHEVSATAFFNEYCQRDFNGKPTKFWLQMPCGQNAKCAEALALRKAFPADMCGLLAKEEMEQADNTYQPPYIPPKNVKTLPNDNDIVLPATITIEQAYLLDDMIGEDDTYRSQFMAYLYKSSEGKITSLEQLPASMFDRCMNGAKANRDKNLNYIEQEKAV